MTVYIVWGWDPMASSWGDDYIENIYASEEKAKQAKERLDSYGYHNKARIEPREVIE